MRYRWRGADGQFPDYEKLIPTEAHITAHLDTVEAGKAIASLKALADSKSYPIDLHLNGGVVISSPYDKGEVAMPADIEGGEVRVRIDGSYLTEALRDCGGMVDFKLTDGKSPVLFAVDGYQLVVMPMLTGEAKAGDKTEAKPEDTEQAEPEPKAEAEPSTEEAEAVAEAETVVKAEKPKRSHKKKEKVAVA
jgi:DNA polymerase-3 subunit beta